jgi:hypothetical protein
MPTLEQEGKLEVNKQYQETIKILINLVTASLVLPIVFLRDIRGVPVSGIKGQLEPIAFVAWTLLGIALLACVGFYVFSTKFTKAVYGMYAEKERELGKTPGSMEITWEKCRDRAAEIATPCAVAGLLCLLIFFLSRFFGGNRGGISPMVFRWRTKGADLNGRGERI